MINTQDSLNTPKTDQNKFDKIDRSSVRFLNDFNRIENEDQPKCKWHDHISPSPMHYFEGDTN